jgi:hypothetical protein
MRSILRSLGQSHLTPSLGRHFFMKGTNLGAGVLLRQAASPDLYKTLIDDKELFHPSFGQFMSHARAKRFLRRSSKRVR